MSIWPFRGKNRHTVHVGEYFNLDELEYAFEFDENEGILLWAKAQRLYFFPLPIGQRSFRPTLGALEPFNGSHQNITGLTGWLDTWVEEKACPSYPLLQIF